MSDAASRGSARTFTDVIFDLGGVVLRWEPQRAYEQVMPADEVDNFMDEICFNEWNLGHDAGRDWDDGEAELISRMPHRREAIEAYRRYFDQTITGMVPGTGAIMTELRQAGKRIVALTNWSADLFHPTRRRYGLLNRFAGIVVSGEEGIAKPDPRLFKIVFERYGINPESAIFIDDNPHNCDTAEALGLEVIRFTDAASARKRLVELGVLDERPAVAGPIYHIAKRKQWDAAKEHGNYCWSTRRVTYENQGFVHCCRADQVADVRKRSYGDLADDELVVLQLDPASLSAPVIMEADPATGEEYPHLYGDLKPAEVTAELELSEVVGAAL
jgi:2-haloacid dehalogenase